MIQSVEDGYLPYLVNFSQWKFEELDAFDVSDILRHLGIHGVKYDIIPDLKILTPDQVRSIPHKVMNDFAEFIFNFSKEQFKILSPKQLKWAIIKPENFKPEYIDILNADQVMALIPDSMNDNLYKRLSISIIQEISQKDINKVPWHILTNKEDFLSVLTKDNVNSGMISKISPDQIKWVPPDYIESFTVDTFRQLRPIHIRAMSLEQLKAFTLAADRLAEDSIEEESLSEKPISGLKV